MADTYKSFATSLGTTAGTTVYPGVVGTAILNSVNCSNTDQYRTSTISIEMIKGSTASGNTLRATAGTTGDIDVIVSVLEIT